jgi:hypothetical protein
MLYGNWSMGLLHKDHSCINNIMKVFIEFIIKHIT